MVYDTTDFTVISRVLAKRMPLITPLGYMAMSMTMGVYYMQAAITCQSNILRSLLQQPLKYE